MTPFIRRSALLVIAWIALGAIVYWPLLKAGYLADDYLQNAMIDGRYPVARSPLDVYTFVRSRAELKTLVDAGALPWWSHPQLTLSALRPLSSALIFCDRLLKLSATARHVHSLLWWTALVAAQAAFMRRLLPAAPAALATLAFVLDPAHLVPLGWIANRTELVSATFGVAALIVHVRFREQGLQKGALASGVLFGLSLAGGEYGLGSLAYLVCYEALVAPGTRRQRLLSLLPAAIPTALYVTVYLVGHFGARASAMYTDPISAPAEFAHHAVVRLPALLASELLILPGELTEVALLNDYSSVLVLILPLALVGALLYSSAARCEPRVRRRLAFLAMGMLTSLLPLIGTLPSTRLLLVPSVGGSALFGVLFWDAYRRLREPGALRRFMPWARALAVSPIAIVHLVLAPLSSHLLAKWFSDTQAFVHRVVREAEIDDAHVASQDLVMLNAPDATMLLYVPHVRHELGSPMPKSWCPLAMTPRPIRIARTAPDTLELSTAAGSLIENPLATVARRPDLPLRSGETVVVRDLEVRVIEVGPEGPRRIAFHFSRPLEDPSLVILFIANNRLARLRVPPVGGVVVTPGAVWPRAVFVQ